MHLSKSPCSAPLQVHNDIHIEPVDASDGYSWLGFNLTYTDKVQELVLKNMEKKKPNIAKFYSWLEINGDTPFLFKMRVLYCCMFESIIYSCESWGDIDHISDSLIAIELKALKSCMEIKQSTPNNIIYAELNRPNIVSVIKDRQYNFFKKFLLLKEEDAIAKQIWSNYALDNGFNNPKPHIAYYNSLSGDNQRIFLNNVKLSISSSTKSMDIRYRNLFDLKFNSTLYDSILIEKYRSLVTRWRLSCHKLHIETGRYKSPKLPREARFCKQCLVVEDEQHALFTCKAHYFVRLRHNEVLSNSSVSALLNPKSAEELKLVGLYLKDIEQNIKALDLMQ